MLTHFRDERFAFMLAQVHLLSSTPSFSSFITYFQVVLAAVMAIAAPSAAKKGKGCSKVLKKPVAKTLAKKPVASIQKAVVLSTVPMNFRSRIAGLEVPPVEVETKSTFSKPAVDKKEVEDIPVALGGMSISKISCKASLEDGCSEDCSEQEVDHVDEDLGEADGDTSFPGFPWPELQLAVDEVGVEFVPEKAFRWRICGGAFNPWKTCAVADHCKAFAPCAWIKSWCDAYMWPKERNFSVTKFTYEGSCRLAAEFCRRSNHYYEVWWTGDDWLLTYTDFHRPEDCEEFTMFLGRLEEGHPVFEAFESMQALVPVIRT